MRSRTVLRLLWRVVPATLRKRYLDGALYEQGKSEARACPYLMLAI
jgi:hypothetical protein